MNTTAQRLSKPLVFLTAYFLCQSAMVQANYSASTERVHQELARVYLRHGQLAPAKELFEKGIALKGDPNQTRGCYMGLADIAQLQGLPRAAAGLLEKASALSRNTNEKWEVTSRLFHVHLSDPKLKGAAPEVAERLLRIAELPWDKDAARAALWVSFDAIGTTDAKLREYEQRLTSDAQDLDVCEMMLAYHKNTVGGQIDKAIDLARRIALIKKTDPWSWFQVGDLLLRESRTEEANQACDRALSATGKGQEAPHALMWSWLAGLCERLDRSRDAATCLARAILASDDNLAQAAMARRLARLLLRQEVQP